MKRYAPVSIDTLRRAAVRGALTAAAVFALFLVGLLSPGATEGTTPPFNVNDAVTKLEIFYRGTCDPGNLQAPPIPASGVGSIINVSGRVDGCVGIEVFPVMMLVESELIGFANVYTATTEAVPASGWDGRLEVLACPGFDDNGQLYVGTELMTYTEKTCGVSSAGHFTISLPRSSPQAHPPVSFVRAEGKLKIAERGKPTYVGGDPTPVTSHSGGLTRLTTYLSCRARLKQTKVEGGGDPVLSRARCYARLQPDGAWTDEPKIPSLEAEMPALPMNPISTHDLSTGTIDDQAVGTDVKLLLTTDFGGGPCFQFVQGWLWLQMTSSITVDKNRSPQDTDDGWVRISVHTDKDCAQTAPWVVGEDDGMNLTSTEIDPTTDTDQDGCTDFDELGGDEMDGGLRDPYNFWDFYDVVDSTGTSPGDGTVDLVNDIFALAARFDANDAGGSATVNRNSNPLTTPVDAAPAYHPLFDRGANPLADSNNWNLDRPDGIIDLVNDIFHMADQFDHSCI